MGKLKWIHVGHSDTDFNLHIKDNCVRVVWSEEEEGEIDL
jgi:hypothetical protein